MADGVFGPITRRLRARNKRKERLAADKKSEQLRKRGAKNRSKMMDMLEKKGAATSGGTAPGIMLRDSGVKPKPKAKAKPASTGVRGNLQAAGVAASKPKAKAKPASTGVRGNLASAGAASAGRAARADKAKKATKRFEQDTKDLGAANMRMNAAQKKKKAAPKPAEKKERFGVGDKYVIRGNKANVREDQLEKTGLTQAQYMKQWRASGKRPTAATAKKAAPKKAAPSGRSFDATKPNQGGPGMASIKPPKGPMSPMAAAQALGAKGEDEMPRFARGGMMKSKMSTKGGAMGGKKKMPPGMEKGGPVGGSKFPDLNKDGKVTQADILMGRGVGQKAKAKKAASKKPARKRTMMPGMTTAKMPKIKGAEGINKKGVYQKGGSVKPKGMKAGGMKMKSKMSTKGGSAGGGGYKKGGKVRGAGIARKGVRPVKMR